MVRTIESFTGKSITHVIETYPSHPDIKTMSETWDNIKIQETSHKTATSTVELYKTVISFYEKTILTNKITSSTTTLYQTIFIEMELLIAYIGNDIRHKFVIVIPVADRPQQLANCLHSILELCKRFGYGGFANKVYRNISVVIADDSNDMVNINRNKQLTRQFNKQGLETFHLDQIKQLGILNDWPIKERAKLNNIIGLIDPNSFAHKGASIMRNIAYIYLNKKYGDESNTLFYFIDSDQEFKINVISEDNNIELFAINYFYQLDRIFRNQECSILTGKVVGDPPVSPAVMASNFIEDAASYLYELALLNPDKSCQFHSNNNPNSDNASYHDMADLFGFKLKPDVYRYQCTRKEDHNNSDCLFDFSKKINQFFEGAHPTRKTYYEYEDPVESIQPARTIYTGNYIFNKDGLNFFIPFAKLNLRMAGPVLGRLIQSIIQNRFISSNLPLLHKRTNQETGISEFRPGICRRANNIDLSGEYERQYFGDVMLFSIEKLIENGYPKNKLSIQEISKIVFSIESQLLEKYISRQVQIVGKLKQLRAIFEDKRSWWQNRNETEQAKINIQQLIDNIDMNFGKNSSIHTFIGSTDKKDRHIENIIQAISEYSNDIDSWNHKLSNNID
ncbi:MAG: hypothetical protein GY934_11005 [Gammaproteobacteria bacterium]|nr:hypothetical protein [Gammaproteobacteria bacterium]